MKNLSPPPPPALLSFEETLSKLINLAVLSQRLQVDLIFLIAFSAPEVHYRYPCDICGKKFTRQQVNRAWAVHLRLQLFVLCLKPATAVNYTLETATAVRYMFQQLQLFIICLKQLLLFIICLKQLQLFILCLKQLQLFIICLKSYSCSLCV